MTDITYEAAAVLFVLNRDTEPDGDKGLTFDEIRERIQTLTPEEKEQVDALFLSMAGDDMWKNEALIEPIDDDE